MQTDTIEPWVKIIGAAAAILTCFKALAEWRRSTQQRQEEHALRQREYRQKQAVFGRELVREVFSDPKARTALRMLDYLDREYVDADSGAKHRIRRNSDIQPAMRPYSPEAPVPFTAAEAFVRTNFESLYDHLEQIEHLIKLGVVAFEDVETAFRYYLMRAIRPNIEHFAFLDYYDYPKAKDFLRRFEGKEKSKAIKA